MKRDEKILEKAKATFKTPKQKLEVRNLPGFETEYILTQADETPPKNPTSESPKNDYLLEDDTTERFRIQEQLLSDKFEDDNDQKKNSRLIKELIARLLYNGTHLKKIRLQNEYMKEKKRQEFEKKRKEWLEKKHGKTEVGKDDSLKFKEKKFDFIR